MKTIKSFLLYLLPYNRKYRDFRKAKQQVDYLMFLKYKLGLLKSYWPINKSCTVANINNIYIGINCLIGRPGAYLQGAGQLYIGDYVQLGPNVGLLTSNHDLYDQRKYNNQKVIIGGYSWIGMNSVVLPGVKLGTRTIVAAGSVVTKSFPEGYCVIGGTPAKVIKILDKTKFKPWKHEAEYYGFVPREEFEKKHPDIVEKLNTNLVKEI
ncbi:acyltransferase [Winogradskyella sp. SM1960]|uniref:acyltransferase n=1 Tax=Winogradskyella sp. SM1960 TaxID=2865955 RepID=UPI00293D87B6|nr:DapH/DapD/GlmU-related protein [Winogradskyella sp. SM1960]